MDIFSSQSPLPFLADAILVSFLHPEILLSRIFCFPLLWAPLALLFHSGVSILPLGSPQPPHTEPNSSSGLKPPTCSLKFFLRLADNLLALAFAAGAATSIKKSQLKAILGQKVEF